MHRSRNLTCVIADKLDFIYNDSPPMYFSENTAATHVGTSFEALNYRESGQHNIGAKNVDKLKKGYNGSERVGTNTMRNVTLMILSKAK